MFTPQINTQFDFSSSQFQGELCRPINRISDINSTTTTVRTVCPITYSDLAPPATVQSPCVIMQVKGTINQPVATPALQRQQREIYHKIFLIFS